SLQRVAGVHRERRRKRQNALPALARVVAVGGIPDLRGFELDEPVAREVDGQRRRGREAYDQQASMERSHATVTAHQQALPFITSVPPAAGGALPLRLSKRGLGLRRVDGEKRRGQRDGARVSTERVRGIGARARGGAPVVAGRVEGEIAAVVEDAAVRGGR